MLKDTIFTGKQVTFSIWNSEEGAEVMEQKQSITILKFL
jgi:hypothetical protein